MEQSRNPSHHVVMAIYDSKGDFWLPPQVVRNKATAMRSWSEVVRNPETMISRHPEDFTAFLIATFDERTGQISPFQAPDSLGVASTLIRRPASPDELPLRKAGA